MNADQLSSLERTILGLAALILTAYLTTVLVGKPEFDMAFTGMIGLDGAVFGYWFGQASATK